MKHKVVIEDAYFPCCEQKFTDLKVLVDHQLSNLHTHGDQIIRQIRQHTRMWSILKKQGRALEMRRLLDAGEFDWWGAGVE